MAKVKKKYLDISSIYNIESITSDYVKVSIGGEKKFVYIFKIEPVIVINSENMLKTSLVYKYEEFLRSINLDFQIISETKEIDVNKYFEIDNVKVEEKKKKLAMKYVENLKDLLKNTKIYITEYYLIISNNLNVENVENYIKIFDESELIVKKVTSKQEIEEIIMKGVSIY